MERKAQNRVFLLGLDGATWDLLKPWSDTGELPLFKQLMKKGSHGVLKSTIPCQTIPAVPTMYTGKNPAKLGISGPTLFDGSLVTYSNVKEPALWDLLGEYGYKSAIVALSATYPPESLNGIMISGGSPSEESIYTYPKRLKEQVKGFYSIDPEFGKLKHALKKNAFNLIIKDMERKFDLSREFIFADYDFILYWIRATDLAQHFLWHQRSKLLEVYKEVEKILNQILQNFTGNLFIVSDHGGNAAPTTEVYLNMWLKKEGYFKLRGTALQQWLKCTFAYLVTTPPYRYRKIIKDALRIILTTRSRLKASSNQAKRKRKASESKSFFPLLHFIDLENTVAYSDRSWGIWMRNKKSKRDYERVRNEIIGKLRNLRDINNRNVIQDVMKREQVYKGKYIERIPDILFLTNEEFIVNSWMSNSVFHKRKEKFPTGTHLNTAREGIFIAYGPDIKENVELGEADITDIFPTILHLFHLPLPQDIDGKVLKNIFKKELKVTKKLIFHRKKWSEKKRVTNRLRKLKLKGRI